MEREYIVLVNYIHVQSPSKTSQFDELIKVRAADEQEAIIEAKTICTAFKGHYMDVSSMIFKVL